MWPLIRYSRHPNQRVFARRALRLSRGAHRMLEVPFKHKRERRCRRLSCLASQPNHQSAGTISITCSCSSVLGMFHTPLRCGQARQGWVFGRRPVPSPTIIEKSKKRLGRNQPVNSLRARWAGSVEGLQSQPPKLLGIGYAAEASSISLWLSAMLSSFIRALFAPAL